MAVSRNAVIERGKVTNVVLYDPAGGTWTPPTGSTIVESATANIGDLWDGVTFTRPVIVAAPTVVQLLRTRMASTARVIWRDATLPESLRTWAMDMTVVLAMLSAQEANTETWRPS